MLIIEWCFQYALEQAFKMPFVGCCGFFVLFFLILWQIATGFWLLPASSVLRSLSVINYQNWLEFVLQSSHKEVMKRMLSFVLYEQTFSRDMWLQIWKAGIHNKNHSYLVHNPCPPQSAIIQLRYMESEDRFSLCLSCSFSWYMQSGFCNQLTLG